MAEAETPHASYPKVYATLLVLLCLSLLGPLMEVEIITLISAFGIAVVKAYLVAKHFMHVNLTPKFIPYLMTTCLVFMLLFFAGVSPDVMKTTGDNWKKDMGAWLHTPEPMLHGVEMPVIEGAPHGGGH